MVMVAIAMGAPMLQCHLFASPNCESADAELDLEPDSTKKSVQWLSLPDGPKSCSKVVLMAAADASTTRSNTSLFFGGFQLISTAKSVQVYINDSETMLMSARGIRTKLEGSNNNEENSNKAWTKAQCVVPGGSRPVTSVRLVLQGAIDDDNNQSEHQSFLLEKIRWTVRIPPAAAVQPERAAAAVPPLGSPPNNPLTQTMLSPIEMVSQVMSQAERLIPPAPSQAPPAAPQVPPPQLPTAGSNTSAAPLPEAASATLSMQLGLLTQQMAALTASMNGLNSTIREHQRFLQEQQDREQNNNNNAAAGAERDPDGS